MSQSGSGYGAPLTVVAETNVHKRSALPENVFRGKCAVSPAQMIG
jgi:hypothetical protein